MSLKNKCNVLSAYYFQQLQIDAQINCASLISIVFISSINSLLLHISKIANMFKSKRKEYERTLREKMIFRCIDAGKAPNLNAIDNYVRYITGGRKRMRGSNNLPVYIPPSPPDVNDDFIFLQAHFGAEAEETVACIWVSYSLLC